MKQDVVGYAKSMATYDDNEWHEQWREHYKEADKAEQERYASVLLRGQNIIMTASIKTCEWRTCLSC